LFLDDLSFIKLLLLDIADLSLIWLH